MYLICIYIFIFDFSTILSILFISNYSHEWLGKSISMLEWGITLEIKPKADLLFMLADACCSGGRWEKNVFLNYGYYHFLYHFEESQHV